MLNYEKILLIDVYFFITLILTLAFPLLLPEYPIGFMETLIGAPHITHSAEYMLFLMLVIFAMADLVIVLGIRGNKLLPSLSEKGKYLIMVGLANGCLIYGLLAELLVWINMLSRSFTIIFIVVGFVAYLSTKL